MKTFVILLVVILNYESIAQSLFLVPVQKTFEKEKGKTSIDRFYFHGVTSVNTTEELINSIQGSQKFSFTGIIVPQREPKGSFWSKPGMDFSVGMNVLNLKPSGVDRDSFDLISLMFPETGNFGLMLNPAIHWGLINKKDSVTHRFSSEISYSLRQNRVHNVIQNDSVGNPMGDPATVNFSIINLNVMPLRYTFSYNKDNTEILFNLGLYLNWFNVPDEDVVSFNKLYPVNNPVFNKKEKSNILGIGMKLSLSVNGFIIFADLRQNTSTNNFTDENPYKGFIFNTGIAQNIQVFSK